MSVAVKPGDAVKRGQVLLILEVNQLVKVYKNDWSFFGTCDSWVYLSGSTEPETTKVVFQKLRETKRFTRKQEIEMEFALNL